MPDLYSLATQGQYSTTEGFVLGTPDGFYTITVTETIIVKPGTGTSGGGSYGTGASVPKPVYQKQLTIDVDVLGEKYTCETVVNNVELSVDDVKFNNEDKQVTVMMKAASFEDTEPETKKITVDLIKVLEDE